MFVSLRSFDNYIPANIMLQRLEAEGIRAHLINEHTITIDPFLSNAIGGIQLMVFKEQAERALQLITEFETEYTRAGACPNCGSTDVESEVTIPNSNSLMALFGKITSATEYEFHCNSCGHHYHF